MLTLIVVAFASITSPRANMVANRMPMEVSELRPARRLTVLTRMATAIPVGTAAIAGLMPTRYPSTIPGSTAWARASPMKARFLVTAYAPTSGHITPTRVAPMRALTMKPCSSGATTKSITSSC